MRSNTLSITDVRLHFYRIIFNFMNNCMYMKKNIKLRCKYSSEISEEQISEYTVLEISCTVSHKEFNKRTHITYISRI